MMSCIQNPKNEGRSIMKKVAPITALFLDIGGVLLNDGWGHQSREMAAMVFNLDLAEINHRHQLTVETYEVGKLTLEEYLSLVVFYREQTFSRIEFQKFMFEQSKPHPRMIELIHKLKAQYLSLIHISEPTRLGMISYAVFCLKKKKKKQKKQ